MFRNRLLQVVLAVGFVSSFAVAGDLRISLPKRDKVTPVQQLNREGVDALRKNQFEKARSLFYKAYLFDPEDPFTLNNLGYISELEGQVERAHRFYELAGAAATEAVVDKATAKSVEGKTVAQVASAVDNKTMQVNRANVEAIRLLSQGRAPEAEQLLQRTLTMEPRNPFTLNNYAVAKEMEGEYEEALKYYTATAKSGSSEPVIVTMDKDWRGKPLDKMAEESAKKVQDRIRNENDVEAQVRRFNLRGVSALNRNARYDARAFFEEAYKLDPDNPFVLNNRGYLAEMDGDTETAQYFYEKARKSDQADLKVGYATRLSAEGKKLFEVADDNNRKMDSKMAQQQEARRRQTGPVLLRRRDNRPVGETQQDTPQNQPETPTLGPPQPPVPQLTNPAPPTQAPPQS